MRPSRLILPLVLILLAVTPAQAGDTWIVRIDMWGSPAFSTLTLDVKEGRASGELGGDRIKGTARNGAIDVDSRDAQGRAYRYTLKLRGLTLTGTADMPDSNNPAARAAHALTGWRVPDRVGGPRTIEYHPVDYSNTWNADRPPVLVVWPGDTIHTSTIDSGGVDDKGVTRALFGNPQTGPFFVAGAEPGDTLVVHIRQLTLNRDYADSLDTIVSRALGASLAAKTSDLGKPVRWIIDRNTGRARPESAEGALAGFSVPVKPMLGGMAVAPGFGMPAISTGDTGRFGGNMDFNEVTEGNTIYLPVQQPGALLYLGDAHALQGDGELTQYALETSMDVTVVVDLIKGQAIGMPRVESPSEIMVLGQAGSLDEALKAASTGMIDWLLRDYGLSLSQAAQVLGSAIRYTVPNLAGRSVGVAARLDKALLPPSRRVVSKGD